MSLLPQKLLARHCSKKIHLGLSFLGTEDKKPQENGPLKLGYRSLFNPAKQALYG